MITDQNRIFDGFTSLEAGVDAGRNPSSLEANQCVSAENMTFRGGHVGPRPGFRKLTETFANPSHNYDSNGNEFIDRLNSAVNAYRDGIFQGATVFNTHNGPDCIVASIGGRIFQLIPTVNEARVTDLSIQPPYPGFKGAGVPGPLEGRFGFNQDFYKARRNNSKLPIAYMTQADKWLVIQDGESRAIIYDGATCRRSRHDASDIEKTEVPVGTIMAYGMGRIVVVVHQRDIAFGDLYGSHILSDPADSLPFFTERNFLAEGFDASIPFQQGVVTGMAFFPQLDTSTGNGQLLAFAERGAAAFFLSLPRDQWKTSAFQILALLTTGLRGHRTISAVNEDLWFRADDGVRSFRQARSEPSGWAHIPLSTNVRQFLDTDTDSLLKYGSSIYFDNRIIQTCSPRWNNGRVFHDGLVVVDFDVISSFGTKYRPAWEGHWHKMKICQVLSGRFNGKIRAFVFGIDEANENQLYELSLDDKDDWDGMIDWEMVTRMMAFKGQSNEFTETEIYDGDLWMNEVIE